jgi:hypothetical protein
LPIFWNDNGFVLADELGGYVGILLALNECDRPDQCNRSPAEAAVIWHALEQVCPGCLLVGPNISQAGIPWLMRFVREYHRLYGRYPEPWRWAAHYYTIYNQPQTFGELMADLCRVIEATGQLCKDVWITEFGSCGENEMYRLVREISHHPQVDRFAVFTNRSPGVVPWPKCLALIDDDGQLAPSGRGWLRGMTAP